MRYTIPAAQVAAPHTATVEIQKSRFIGWCAHAPDTDTARALVAAARAQYPDASHHCSAYIAGAPEEQQAIGFADDGEPGGTAGRPMFQALAGSGPGSVAISYEPALASANRVLQGASRSIVACHDQDSQRRRARFAAQPFGTSAVLRQYSVLAH